MSPLWWHHPDNSVPSAQETSKHFNLSAFLRILYIAGLQSAPSSSVWCLTKPSASAVSRSTLLALTSIGLSVQLNGTVTSIYSITHHPGHPLSWKVSLSPTTDGPASISNNNIACSTHSGDHRFPMWSAWCLLQTCLGLYHYLDISWFSNSCLVHKNIKISTFMDG